MSAYKIREFDLAAARDKIAIYDRAVPIATVSVIQLPAGSNVTIRFGQGSDDIPLLNQGMEFKPCPPEREGVYISNPAGAGTLKLLVSFEEGEVGVST